MLYLFFRLFYRKRALRVTLFPSIFADMKPWYTKAEISTARSTAQKILSTIKINDNSITCHVRIPKSVNLSNLFPKEDVAPWRLKKASLIDKEVEISIRTNDYTFTPKPKETRGKIRLDLYAYRSRESRLKQCGLFEMLEYNIPCDLEHDLAEELAKFLVKILHLSKSKKLTVEFDDLDNLPDHLKYLSDDSSDDCY